MHSVIANKSTDSIRTMLPSTAPNITCDTDIKGAITLAGEEVDTRTLLTHSAALGPRFRGDDENLSSLPSEDTEARWVRHTPIYATRYYVGFRRAVVLPSPTKPDGLGPPSPAVRERSF